MTRAVLFDRDGTLVENREVLRDPADVAFMPHAREALARLRERGLRIGVVTNQPSVADRRVTARELQAVHARIGEAIGPIDGWFVCTHSPSASCECRKPQPGLVIEASRAFHVPASACVVVGDIGSDVEAARQAGARSVLVPTHETLPAEIQSAPAVAGDLLQAAELVLSEAV